MVRSRLRDLKGEIKKMNDDEKEIEKTNEILDIVGNIIELDNQNQQRQVLKILTLDQVLSRLSISLAQFKAGRWLFFKIKTGYKLELLFLETMKLLGSTKKMLIKIKIEKMYRS